MNKLYKLLKKNGVECEKHFFIDEISTSVGFKKNILYITKENWLVAWNKGRIVVWQVLPKRSYQADLESTPILTFNTNEELLAYLLMVCDG